MKHIWIVYTSTVLSLSGVAGLAIFRNYGELIVQGNLKDGITLILNSNATKEAPKPPTVVK